MFSLSRSSVHARCHTAAARACCAASGRPLQLPRRPAQSVRAAAAAAAVTEPAEVGPVCRELLGDALQDSSWSHMQQLVQQSTPPVPNSWYLDGTGQAQSNLATLAVRVARFWAQRQSQILRMKTWRTDLVAANLAASAYKEYRREASAARPSSEDRAVRSDAAELDAVLLKFLQLVSQQSQVPAGRAASMGQEDWHDFASAARSALLRVLVTRLSSHSKSTSSLQPAAEQGRIDSLAQQVAEQQRLLEQVQGKLDQQSGLLQTLLGRYTSEQLGEGSSDAGAGPTDSPIGCKPGKAFNTAVAASGLGSGNQSGSSSSSSSSSTAEPGAGMAALVGVGSSGSLPAAAVGAPGSLPPAPSPVAGLREHLLAHMGATASGAPGPFEWRLVWPDWTAGKVADLKRLLVFQSYDDSGVLCTTVCALAVTALPMRPAPSGDGVEIGVEVGLVLGGWGSAGFEGSAGPAVPIRIRADSSAKLYIPDMFGGQGSVFYEAPLGDCVAGNLVFGGRGLVVRWGLSEEDVGALGLKPRDWSDWLSGSFHRYEPEPPQVQLSQVVLDLVMKYEIGL